MNHPYVLVDVFTDRPFSGNALAVFPDARGLSEARMQAVARELNLSETTFVSENRVRIFTPEAELSFAGHPTLGTAAVLHGDGADGVHTLQLIVGPVPVNLQRTPYGLRAELTAPPAHLRAAPYTPEALSTRVGLSVDALEPALPPVLGSCGTEFLLLGVRSRQHVSQARLMSSEPLSRKTLGLMVFAVEQRAAVHARVFIPGSSVSEDPATGSAHAPLVAYLLEQGFLTEDERLIGSQGLEMGRPSRIESRMVRQIDGSLRPHVAGGVVRIGTGALEL